jgi:polysaccharide pyruvyl transferase WcaK-like protein
VASVKPVAACAIGYQGFGNIGDEAILTGIERLLASTPIVVSSLVVGDRAQVPGFPDARRFVGRRLLPTPRRLVALRGVRLLIFSGGGLLHDHWPLVLPQYLGWSVAARVLGIEVVWLGVGIGPLRHRRSRWLARLILRLARTVLVRDEASRRLAHALGRPDATVIPDPAFFNVVRSTGARSGLGVVVRAPVQANRALEDRLAGTLSALIAERKARGGSCSKLLTFAGSRDRPFADRVAARVASLGQTVEVEELSPDPIRVAGRLSEFEAIVTVRLHGLILGSLTGTPWVAIGYDDKIAAVAHSLGAEDQVIPLETLDVPALTDALALAATAARRRSVEAIVDTFRESGRSIAAQLSASVA